VQKVPPTLPFAKAEGGGNVNKKNEVSEECAHNQHDLCKLEGCVCGCHFIERNGGPTPEEFRGKMRAIKAYEERVIK
jgi:hypothetical protein